MQTEHTHIKYHASIQQLLVPWLLKMYCAFGLKWLNLLVWCSHCYSIRKHQSFHIKVLRLVSTGAALKPAEFQKTGFFFYTENASKLVAIIIASANMKKAGKLQTNQIMFYFFLESLGSRRQRQSVPLCSTCTVPVNSTVTLRRAWLGSLQSSKTYQKTLSEYI